MKSFIGSKKTLKKIILFLLIIGILVVAGCVDKPQSELPNNLKDSDVWYNFAKLLTPGYYFQKTASEIYNSIVDIKNTLKSLIPGFSDLDDIQSLADSINSANSATFIESYLLEAGGKCGRVELSDMDERVELHVALKHFGDLYGDGNPNTNPTINDLKNTKGLAECFLDKYGTKSPEGKYLSQVTSSLIKFLDSKISSGGQAVPKTTKINLEEGELGYDDGEKNSIYSLGGGTDPKIGHLVRFTAPTDGFVINKVNVYGFRFGDGKGWYNLGKSFDLEIWDNDLKTIYSISSDYDKYFPKDENNIKWVEIDIPSIKVNNDFYIFFNGNSIKSPMAEGGIYVGIDTDTISNRSFIALSYSTSKKILTDWSEYKWSENSVPPPQKYNWMIRVSSK